MNNDIVLKDLLSAYFSEYAIFTLGTSFDKLFSAVTSPSNKESAHSTQLLKLILSLLMTTLVEHGQLNEVNRYVGNNSSQFGMTCSIPNFTTFCAKLGRPSDYTVWTHMILYLTNILRVGKFPDISDSKVSSVALNVQDTQDEFVTNAVLALYAILFVRLTVAVQTIPGDKSRYAIESCFFASIICFYNDYVTYTKGISLGANVPLWELLLEQVRKDYMKKDRLFTTLKLKYDREAYLQQDNIAGVQGCITKQFIDKYRQSLSSVVIFSVPASKTSSSFSLPSLPSYFSTSTESKTTSPDIYQAITCLHNIDVNSISMKFNRWFRYLVYNKVSRGTVSSGSTLTRFVRTIYNTGVNSFEGFRDAIVFGQDMYNTLYSKNWPKVSGAAALAVAVVAFTGKRLVSTLSNSAQLVTAATVYAFRKQDLLPVVPNSQFRYEKPKHPAYLVWERSSDGTYSVIYNISPTPSITMDPSATISYIQRGGSKKGSDELMALSKALRKGFIKNELPIEMQNYIKKKMNLNTNMRGGSSLSNIYRLHGGTDFIIPGDKLPEGYSAEIIDKANEPSYFRQDEDGVNIQLVLPKPPLEKEALENAEFIDVADPNLDKQDAPKSETQLPDPVPEIPLATKTTSSFAFSHHREPKSIAPPPPVVPAARSKRKTVSWKKTSRSVTKKKRASTRRSTRKYKKKTSSKTRSKTKRKTSRSRSKSKRSL